MSVNRPPDSDDPPGQGPKFEPVPQPRDPTETIDFDRFQIAADLTTSASFDLRGIKQAEYGKLLQAIPIPIFFIDKNHAIVFVTRTLAGVANNNSDVNGKTFSDLFPDLRESCAADKLLEEVFSDRKPQVVEGLVRIGDREIWGRIHLRSIRVKEKQLALAILEDLTFEKNRLILNEKYRRLFSLLPIGIIEFALVKPITTELQQGEALKRILEACAVDGNEEFARLHGYDRVTDIIGSTLGDIMPYSRPNKALFHSWIRGGFAINSAETKEIMGNGVVRYLDNILIGVLKENALLGFWLAKRDITERQGMTDERLRAQKLESVGILAGGIAHDFNNFLTVIMGKIGLAKLRMDTNDKIYQLLNDAEQGAMRAKDLTTQLLGFSKEQEPVKKVCRLRPRLEDWVTFALTGSRVSFDFAIEEDLWPVEIDEAQVSQVVNNIALNAAQATGGRGWLHVTAHNVVVGSSTGVVLNDGPYVRVSLQDNGAGIAEEHVHRVFDPYFTTKQEGSGLGLATSYSIVKSHDGTITVDSELNIGTTFHIYLPASFKEVVTIE